MSALPDDQRVATPESARNAYGGRPPPRSPALPPTWHKARYCQHPRAHHRVPDRRHVDLLMVQLQHQESSTANAQPPDQGLGVSP